jgi:hypothetical protein
MFFPQFENCMLAKACSLPILRRTSAEVRAKENPRERPRGFRRLEEVTPHRFKYRMQKKRRVVVTQMSWRLRLECSEAQSTSPQASRKGINSFAVSWGLSSARKWPAGRACPRTLEAYSRQTFGTS